MCFLFICSVRCYILFGENCHWSPVLRFPSTSPKKCGAWWLNRWLLVNIIISSNLCCIYMHLPIPPNFFMTHDDYLLEWWGYLLEWSWMICQCRIPIRIFLMWHRVFFSYAKLWLQWLQWWWNHVESTMGISPRKHPEAMRIVQGCETKNNVAGLIS